MLFSSLEDKKNEIAQIENDIQILSDYNKIVSTYKKANLISFLYNVENPNTKSIANKRLKEIALQEGNPWYLDINKKKVSIFPQVEELKIQEAVNALDLQILLDWYEANADKSPYDQRYSIAGSKEEQKVFTTAKQIEENLIDEAVKARDESIITSYFSTNPYKKLTQNQAESFRKNGWEQAEADCLESYHQGILLAEEKVVYEQAIEQQNPSIYTSKYPNGSFDTSNIPDDVVGRAFETALESVENAKEFLENFENSKYHEEIRKFILREEWFKSDTYKNALENIPEEMLEAEVMIREGIVDVEASFREFFIDRAPITDCEFDIKDKNITVKIEGTESQKFTIIMNMLYRAAYGGMMYVDTIEVRQSWLKREQYRTFNEKYSAICAINLMFL